MVSDMGPTDFTLPDALSMGDIRGATVNTGRRVTTTSQVSTPGNDDDRTTMTGTVPGNDHRPVAFGG